MHFTTRPRHAAALAFGAGAALLLAACSSATSAPTSAAAPTDAAAVAALEQAFTGVTGTPPTIPTVPQPGVDVWVVSCGQQIPACSTPSAAVEEAAALIGWNATTCDGMLNPDGWGTCVRQAVSAGAEVVIPLGIDCASVSQPFREARDAGVAVIGGGGADCDATGGEALWASERLQLADLDVQASYEEAGALAAKYLIGSTDAAAKVLVLEFEDPLWGPWLTEGFERELATCSGCEIVGTLPLSNGDVAGGTAVGKFSAALQKATTADAVWVPVGGWMPSGFAQAVVASGRNADLTVVSGYGDASNYGLIAAQQGQDAAIGYNTAWGAWGSVDTAIRVLNGEPAQLQGNGMAVVDARNGMPPEGQDWTGGVDYEAAYRQVWGVG